MKTRGFVDNLHNGKLKLDCPTWRTIFSLEIEYAKHMNNKGKWIGELYLAQHMNETHLVNRVSERIAYFHVANNNYIINHVVNCLAELYLWPWSV